MSDTCVVEGCDKPRYQYRVYCCLHAMRKHRYGDPLATPPPRFEDKTGRRYGRLTVLARVDKNSWSCRCDCGKETVVRTGGLNNGSTASCGAHRKHDTVGYAGAHDRVEAVRGRAKNHPCVDCDRPAHDWSYNHNDPDEQVSEYGPFSSDPGYYEPRCRRCHRIFDGHPFMRNAG
jgi:hypothetical protein